MRSRYEQSHLDLGWLQMELFSFFCTFIVNPIALRKAKIVYNFGLSQCNRVKEANSLAARICAFTTLYKDGTEGTCYWDKGCASFNMQKGS